MLPINWITYSKDHKLNKTSQTQQLQQKILTDRQLGKSKHWKLQRSLANTKIENGRQLKTLEKTLTPLAKPPQVDPNNK